MPDETTTSDELSYEQARDELVSVVQRLEAGGTSLEESIALWERGEQLAAICQRWLGGASSRRRQGRRVALQLVLAGRPGDHRRHRLGSTADVDQCGLAATGQR